MSPPRERFREDLLTWAETHLRDFPWRDESLSVYEVFVAEFFLTQTPANNVAEVYPTFLERFPDLGTIRGVNESELISIIEPLGFYRMRADALTDIADQHDELPTDPDELQELPRIGPYVANATLCIAHNRPLPLLDRNVIRVYERVFGDAFPDTESTRREFAAEMLPGDGELARRYNLALLDFGAIVCQKRDPKHDDCFATEYCSYYASESDG